MSQVLSWARHLQTDCWNTTICILICFNLRILIVHWFSNKILYSEKLRRLLAPDCWNTTICILTCFNPHHCHHLLLKQATAAAVTVGGRKVAEQLKCQRCMRSTAVHNATEPPGAVKVSTRPVKVSAVCGALLKYVKVKVCGALQYIILHNHLLYRSLSGRYKKKQLFIKTEKQG